MAEIRIDKKKESGAPGKAVIVIDQREVLAEALSVVNHKIRPVSVVVYCPNETDREKVKREDVMDTIATITKWVKGPDFGKVMKNRYEALAKFAKR